MSQFIKAGGGNGCADGDTCPSAVHTGSERQTFLVVGTRVTNPADLQQLNIGAGEVANEIPDSLFPEARPLVTAPAALGAFIDRQGPGELVRVETLLRYDVESDGGDFRRYRDGLPGPDPARKAARHRVLKARRDRGLVMRRVHIVRTPLADPYLPYECEWGYLLNTSYEDIRILDVTEQPGLAPLLAVGDFTLVNAAAAIMAYDDGGRYLGFREATEATLPLYAAVASAAWDAAAPFGAWWDGHREYWRANQAA